MKVIVVSCFFVSLITLHQRNLSMKQENVLIYFIFTYWLNMLSETMQQILPNREDLWVTSAIQEDHYDHKKLEEENRVRSTSTLPHGKLHHGKDNFPDCKMTDGPWCRNDCCSGLLGWLLPQPVFVWSLKMWGETK